VLDKKRSGKSINCLTAVVGSPLFVLSGMDLRTCNLDKSFEKLNTKLLISGRLLSVSSLCILRLLWQPFAPLMSASSLLFELKETTEADPDLKFCLAVRDGDHRLMLLLTLTINQ
jgi:hypothetical protein